MDKYLATISKFVDTAIRYDFEYIKLTYGSKDFMFSIPLTHLALDIENGYNKFIEEVDDIKRVKRGILINTVDRYLSWYKTNKVEIKNIFGEQNVYSVANDTIGFIKKIAGLSSTKSSQAFSLPQIALIYIYNDDESITRDNANEIAKKYGYESLNSGEKLYQKFIKYYNVTDRKGDEGTKRKNNNKIKLLKSVIEFLPEDKHEKVKDEIKTLETLTENTY